MPISPSWIVTTESKCIFKYISSFPFTKIEFHLPFSFIKNMFYLFRISFAFEHSNKFNQSTACISYLISSFQGYLQACWIQPDLWEARFKILPSKFRFPNISNTPTSKVQSLVQGVLTRIANLSHFLEILFCMGF